MTEREKRDQKIRLRVDLEEADSELAHLRERANYVAERLRKIADWLEQSPEVNIFQNGRSIHHGVDVIAIEQRYMDALDRDALIVLGDEIRQTMKRVHDLRERLGRLG